MRKLISVKFLYTKLQKFRNVFDVHRVDIIRPRGQKTKSSKTFLKFNYSGDDAIFYGK